MFAPFCLSLAETASSGGTNWQALLSPLIALGGVVIGVLATSGHSRRQVQATIDIANRQLEANREKSDREIWATVLAANRQKWIDELRTEVAHFISILPAAHGVRPSGANPIEMQALLREMNFHQAKINLLINPQECDCSKLGEIVDRSLHHAADSMENETINHQALSDDMKELVSVSQAIFAQRWQKIQRLE